VPLCPSQISNGMPWIKPRPTQCKTKHWRLMFTYSIYKNSVCTSQTQHFELSSLTVTLKFSLHTEIKYSQPEYNKTAVFHYHYITFPTPPHLYALSPSPHGGYQTFVTAFI
jgi:hypothetical protein